MRCIARQLGGGTVRPGILDVQCYARQYLIDTISFYGTQYWIDMTKYEGYELRVCFQLRLIGIPLLQSNVYDDPSRGLLSSDGSSVPTDALIPNQELYYPATVLKKRTQYVVLRRKDPDSFSESVSSFHKTMSTSIRLRTIDVIDRSRFE